MPKVNLDNFVNLLNTIHGKNSIDNKNKKLIYYFIQRIIQKYKSDKKKLAGCRTALRECLAKLEAQVKQLEEKLERRGRLEDDAYTKLERHDATSNSSVKYKKPVFIYMGLYVGSRMFFFCSIFLLQ